MPERIPIALIGCGGMGRRHLRGMVHLAASTQANIQLVPSYRLEPLAAELFGGERVWTYQLEFNDTDSRLLALEYHELGVCVASGVEPEVTLEEGRRDLALTYAPFEWGVLGRAVTLDEVLTGAANAYQREIDAVLGLYAVGV